MKRCAFEHTFVCVVLRTKKVCCSNTPNLRVQVALKSSLVLNLNLFEWFHGQLCWRFAFNGLYLLPIELCTRLYVSKFCILRAYGLLTSSENWLLFSITSIPTALQISARICP